MNEKKYTDLMLPKLSLTHCWMDYPRGAERVFAEIASLFPDAPIYCPVVSTSADWPGSLARIRENAHNVRCLNWLYNLNRSLLKYLIPFFPFAHFFPPEFIRSSDVILISDAGFAKTVRTRAIKLVYIYTPFRYIWHERESLKRELPVVLYPLALLVSYFLKILDIRAAKRVSSWAVMNQSMKERVMKSYNVPEVKIVIIPPIVPEALTQKLRSRITNYSRKNLLIVSGMFSYKKDALSIELATRLGVPTRVIGNGPELKKLRSIAGPNITFMGWVTDDALVEEYQKAQVLLHPGEEDFGLTVLEAQLAGCPVICFRAGGAVQHVQEGRTGVFFGEQTLESFLQAYKQFENEHWDAKTISDEALQHSQGRFKEEIYSWIRTVQEQN